MYLLCIQCWHLDFQANLFCILLWLFIVFFLFPDTWRVSCTDMVWIYLNRVTWQVVHQSVNMFISVKSHSWSELIIFDTLIRQCSYLIVSKCLRFCAHKTLWRYGWSLRHWERISYILFSLQDRRGSRWHCISLSRFRGLLIANSPTFTLQLSN